MSAHCRILAVFSLLAASPLAADSNQFPRPAELEPDVEFWVTIFTEYTSDQGVLHDNRDLAVVYELLDLPADVSRRDRNRRSDVRRKHYQTVLRSLAGDKRDNLSAEEQRVLDLWPADVTNTTLRDAVKGIRYQQGLSDRFRAGLKRAGRYRDYVNSNFANLGVPIELAALPHVESSYNPDARSHVGASGIWQFTRSTGRRFMQVDQVLDERNDPYAATQAAGKLLAYNYSIAGNWPMAITAYNHGLSGVRHAMRQFGDTAYVRILREYQSRTFGFASRNFYVAFLAAMQVDQNAEQYFPGIVPDRPIDYAVLKLQSYVSADSVAKALSVSQSELARHNPALQPTVWAGSMYIPKGYIVRIPRNSLKESMSQLLAALPADQQFQKQLPDLFHTVARGDTLSEIAEEYQTSVSTLAALNNIGSRNRIRAGQRLRLPAAGPAATVAAVEQAFAAAVEPQVAAAIADAPAIVERADRPTEETGPGALAEEPAGTMDDETQSNLLSDPSDYSVAADNSIEVQPLETLGHFGDWLGIKTQRLRDLNGLAFGTPVAVGQRIKLDLSRVDAQSFENRRTSYHRQQQDSFFRNYKISGVIEHTIKKNESVWILALRQYDVPIWLFRQYNPVLDLQRVHVGTRVRFPVLVSIDG